MKFLYLSSVRIFKYTAIFLLISMGVLSAHHPIIGITQITSHPSLNQVHRGIIDVIEESEYRNAKILNDNPQGNMATAAQIAKKYASLDPDVIVAITTPSAQTMQKATERQGTSLVFATVTDPVKAGLVTDIESPRGRVTGTRNKTPLERHIQLIQDTVPEVERIGVMINHAEQNSVDLVDELKVLTEAAGLELLVVAVNNTNEVSGGAQRLVSKADVILLLQDNTVASALPAVIRAADHAKIPVVATYVEAVEKGAAIGLAFNEYLIGRQTGEIVLRILRGEEPGSIAVQDPESLEILIHRKRANDLKLRLGADLLGKSQFIE